MKSNHEDENLKHKPLNMFIKKKSRVVSYVRYSLPGYLLIIIIIAKYPIKIILIPRPT